MDWRTKAEQLVLDDGFSWREASEHLSRELGKVISYDRVRSTVRNGERWINGERSKRLPSENQRRTEPINDIPAFRSTEKINQDGSRESVKLLELIKGRKYTPDEFLALHGFDPPEMWQVIECKSNVWNGMTGKARNNELVELWQSTIRVKPKGAELTFADIDNYIESKRFPNIVPLPRPTQYDPNGETLEIDLPDFHGGLLAWVQETGADYDIHIAKELFFRCLSDIIERCKNRTFKRILFVTLGDLIHIDNDLQTTTKGTFQQADGRVSKISDAVMDMLIDGIELLSAIAPVHVIYLKGNHDSVTGRLVMQTVHQAFKYRPDNTVTFDMSPNPQKYIEVGCNLIGFTHGCMAGKNMDKWLQIDAREAWGRCKHAEVHQGHMHTQKVIEGKYVTSTQTEDVGGVVVRTMPVICNASYWEHGQGYAGATKAMMCFVWHDIHGLREMWFSCV